MIENVISKWPFVIIILQLEQLGEELNIDQLGIKMVINLMKAMGENKIKEILEKNDNSLEALFDHLFEKATRDEVDWKNEEKNFQPESQIDHLNVNEQSDLVNDSSLMKKEKKLENQELEFDDNYNYFDLGLKIFENKQKKEIKRKEKIKFMEESMNMKREIEKQIHKESTPVYKKKFLNHKIKLFQKIVEENIFPDLQSVSSNGKQGEEDNSIIEKKIILIGPKKSGKTSLLNKFLYKNYFVESECKDSFVKNIFFFFKNKFHFNS